MERGVAIVQMIDDGEGCTVVHPWTSAKDLSSDLPLPSYSSSCPANTPGLAKDLNSDQIMGTNTGN